MSKDSQQPQQSEEVDLGQLFKLIGNMFDRLFKFIGGIFNKLFLAFVWCVFFVKKHFIKLVIAGLIGIGLGFLLEKTSDPVYKSYITVKQNYNTGENLYNTISYYNDLVKQGDDVTLKRVLGDSIDVESILHFDIESVITENQKIKEFDTYLKTLDTTLAKTIEYETYIENSKDYTHKYQQITIKSKKRDNFKAVFEKIKDDVNTNEYFKREQQKDLFELERKKQSLENALADSKSLQETYKEVLTKAFQDNSGSQTSVTIKNSEEENKTREFDLYKNDLELREKLVEIEREIANKKHIIETISSKQDSGSIDNKKEILGKVLSVKIFYGLILTMLTFLVLLGLQLIKYLERFKDKV